MKKILSKFMETDYEMKQIDIGKILSERKLLCVIFPDNLEISYQLFSYFIGWSTFFKQFCFSFSENLIAFFSHLSFDGKVEFVTHCNFIPCENAVLFNFLSENHMQEDIACCQNTLIIDMQQEFNLKISPHPKSELQLLESFATIFSFPLQKSSVAIQPLPDRSAFFDNKDLHIVLDIGEAKYAKYYESIIKMVKNECTANFYITGIPYEQDTFIHVVNIKTNDILQLYKLASNADLFITDDYSLLVILKKHIKNALFFGKENTFSDIPCLHPKNIFELKNLILEMNNKRLLT